MKHTAEIAITISFRRSVFFCRKGKQKEKLVAGTDVIAAVFLSIFVCLSAKSLPRNANGVVWLALRLT